MVVSWEKLWFHGGFMGRHVVLMGKMVVSWEAWWFHGKKMVSWGKNSFIGNKV